MAALAVLSWNAAEPGRVKLGSQESSEQAEFKKKSHTTGLIIDSCPSSIIQYNSLTIIVAIRLGKGFKACPKLHQTAGSSEPIR